MPIFGNDPTQDGADVVDHAVDEQAAPTDTAAPEVAPAAPDIVGSPADPAAPADETPAQEYLDAVVVTNSPNDPVSEPDVPEAPPVVVPDVTVAAVSEADLPDGHTYPLLITTAVGDAYFPSADVTVTLDPQLAELVADTPFASVATDEVAA